MAYESYVVHPGPAQRVGEVELRHYSDMGNLVQVDTDTGDMHLSRMTHWTVRPVQPDQPGAPEACTVARCTHVER